MVSLALCRAALFAHDYFRAALGGQEALLETLFF